MPFQIVHNDITQMHTDAIVNAANRALEAGGGVCGAIFRAAGVAELTRECREKAPCPTGSAVITSGYGLSAKYIIHAVGPIWRGGEQGEKEQLYGAYYHSLELAYQKECQSISFPLISAGIYGYPKEQALKVAIQAIGDFLLKYDMDVYLVVFDRSAVQLSERLFADVSHYIDTYYVPEPRQSRLMESQWAEESVPLNSKKPLPPLSPCVQATPLAEKKKSGKAFSKLSAPFSLQKKEKERRLEDLLAQVNETFSQMLLRLIDEKGYTDVEVYKRANMDRKLFSKIRSNKDYHPKKTTVFSLAIALRLSVDEATDLLKKAGYSFSDSYRQDIIVRYFLEQGVYDIFTINETLFCFEEPLLGA